MSPKHNGGLLPGELGMWRTAIFDRCCTFQSDCWMAWCCPCFVAGQIAEKLKKKLLLNTSGIDYKVVVIGYLFLFIVSRILEAIYPESIATSIIGGFFDYFMIVVVLILRMTITSGWRIPGQNCCLAFLCSCFCMPCSLTQMQYQLWEEPGTYPGCNCSPDVIDDFNIQRV